MPKFPNLPDFLSSPPLPSFGEQLRDARTLRGLSVEDLAVAVDLPPGVLRDIETGKRPAPPKDVVLALAGALRLGKGERELFLSAASLASPIVQTLFGRRPKTPERPAFTAAILVFLIADIRGYTRFTQEHGDAAAARLTARFAELAQSMVEQHDGQFVEARGDEILAAFASARQALRGAHALQTRCTEEAQAHPDLPLAIGVGMDVGEAVPLESGGYRGAALNRAARLCSLAGPGEVLVSAGVAYIAPQVEGVTFVARGQEQLKGIAGSTPILLAAPAEVSSDTAIVEADDEPEEDA